MVGQTTQQNQSDAKAGAFGPVPTRIQDLPELIVEPGNEDAEVNLQNMG